MVAMAFRIDIPWEQPQELASAFCPFHAQFEIDSRTDFSPDERMFALWEKYRHRHTEHVKELANRLVALYRGVASDGQLEDLPKKEILKLTERATVVVYRNEFEGETYYSLHVQFELEWDDEHGYTLPFDEGTETFGAWED
jgi:hypothetical protein